MQQLQWVDAVHLRRKEVEAYVYLRYRKAFDANLQTFMPVFLTLFEEGQIISVCGIRNAAHGPLFLEQYLDLPVDALITQRLGVSVARSQIIEFGQLASFSVGYSRRHFGLMAQQLVERGYIYCIFTATDPLTALMRRMGLPLEQVQAVDANRIPNADNWGDYYHHEPHIHIGRLDDGVRRLVPNTAVANSSQGV